MNNKEYREMLINDILEYQTKEQFTKEELDKKINKNIRNYI